MDFVKEWPRPNVIQIAVFAVCVIMFWIYILTREDGFIWIIDNFNLLMHEGGHFIFSPFGHTMHFLGGTLLQLLLPVGFCVSFWQTNQPAGFAFSGLLLGENFLNVARYVSDARDMALPLVGGGEHDWNTLLGGTFLLRHCRLLGGALCLLGWVVMVSFAAWYVLLFFRDSGEASDKLIEE